MEFCAPVQIGGKTYNIGVYFFGHIGKIFLIGTLGSAFGTDYIQTDIDFLIGSFRYAKRS
jgi:hypothetical protein